MDLIANVLAGSAGGQVAVPAQRHLLVPGRHRSWLVSRCRDVREHRVVHRDSGQRARVALAAPRIGVEQVNQLDDCVLTVAGHAGRPEFGCRGDPAVHDEDPVVPAGNERLDDDLAGA